MIFVKTIKGYEDKTLQLDSDVNGWIAQSKVELVDIKTQLSHEPGARSGSGDLIYTILYKADAPVV